MGIVNVTPDSFSDGGLFLDEQAAVEHGLQLIEQGAHILDVGGESTRPGAQPVPVKEELRRVVPVVSALALRDGPTQISIDTSKAAVAQAAVAAGATLINDVSALRADPDMASVVADSDADCCLMHMLGSPRTMQRGWAAIRRCRRRCQGFPGGASRLRGGRWRRRAAHPARPRHRLRQDRRAQPCSFCAAWTRSLPWGVPS